MRSNPKGVHFERWRHIHGCGRWFNVARDTVSDQILKVYPMGEPRPRIETPAAAARATARGDLSVVRSSADDTP
jgi:sarcosine oxidase, subunit delta